MLMWQPYVGTQSASFFGRCIKKTLFSLHTQLVTPKSSDTCDERYLTDPVPGTFLVRLVRTESDIMLDTEVHVHVHCPCPCLFSSPCTMNMTIDINIIINMNMDIRVQQFLNLDDIYPSLETCWPVYA